MNNLNINVVALLMLAGFITSAGAEPIGEKAAMELPIIDTHFHAMPFMTPDELLTRMDKNNILKIGGAHTSQKPRNDEFVNVLGDRYIRAEGGQMVVVGRKGGASALEDADSFLFQASFNNLKRAVSNYKVRAISEIFVNTTSSAGQEWRRWKIKGDSSGMHALFDLATDNKIPMLVHAQLQGEEGLADELSRLAASRPDGVLVMGHCGKDSTADTMRQFLNKTPNAVCNLAYRSPPQEQGLDENRRIWSSSGIKAEWRQLIEDMPDRFMVGIDDVQNWNEFEEVAATIRKDLLANLTKSTAEKVSYENAKRIYHL